MKQLWGNLGKFLSKRAKKRGERKSEDAETRKDEKEEKREDGKRNPLFHNSPMKCVGEICG